MRTWSERATSEPQVEISTVFNRDYLLAQAYALDGDPSGGWALFSPLIAEHIFSARYVLSQRFLFDSLFGTVPAYRARMLELQAKL